MGRTRSRFYDSARLRRQRVPAFRSGAQHDAKPYFSRLPRPAKRNDVLIPGPADRKHRPPRIDLPGRSKGLHATTLFRPIGIASGPNRPDRSRRSHPPKTPDASQALAGKRPPPRSPFPGKRRRADLTRPVRDRSANGTLPDTHKPEKDATTRTQGKIRLPPTRLRRPSGTLLQNIFTKSTGFICSELFFAYLCTRNKERLRSLTE